MNFSRSDATVFVPDGKPAPAALRRITHLGIGAHADDLEIMAFHGILKGRAFGGVTCTDGAGSPSRLGASALVAARHREQERAARIGRYGVLIQLRHPSRDTRYLEDDLYEILFLTKPRVVYTHNPADKHDTHVAVCVATVRAIRRLPRAARPLRVYGCEVWRSLDWLNDLEKIALDTGAGERLQRKLIGVFRSQLTGKRYDEAALGRARANATFGDPRSRDATTGAWLAMDLTPLARNPRLNIARFVDRHLLAFRRDVLKRLAR